MQLNLCEYLFVSVCRVPRVRRRGSELPAGVAGDAVGGTSMDRGVIGSCWRNGTFGGVTGFLRLSAIVDYLHLCICINTYHNRNDGGSMVSSGVSEKMVSR